MVGHHPNQEHEEVVHVQRPGPEAANLESRDYTATCNLPARRRDLARILRGNLTMEPTSRHLRRGMEATVAKSDLKNNSRDDHFIAHVLLPRWHPRTLLRRNGSERCE
jgi:hypothetical protein